MIKSLKFSHKILLAAALVVIATFSLFTLYNDSLQRTSIREDLEDYLHEMGEITASNVQNWLSGRILLIENLAQTLARDHSPETTQALLEQPLLGSTFLFTYLGQTDGTYTARPTSDLPADYDPRRRPWYNAATSAGQTTLTEPYMEPAIHELVLTIASPARQGGQPFGVVGGDLSLQTVVKIINSLDFGGMGYAFLVSGDGKILVHPDKDQVMKSLSDVYPRNTPKIGSGFSEAELHGNTRILSFSPVKGLSGLDWYIGISVDKDKAYAMLTKLRTSAIVAALIAVVAIVLLLGMLIRVLMQPLTDMGRVPLAPKRSGFLSGPTPRRVMVLTAYTAASIWLASARTRMSWYSACSSAVSPAEAAIQSVGVMAGWPSWASWSALNIRCCSTHFSPKALATARISGIESFEILGLSVRW